MHSRSGYSGSPVFIYRNAGSVFLDEDKWTTGHFLALLGMHWGQFPERWPLKDETVARTVTFPVAGGSFTVDGRLLITGGKYVEGLSGMTCVIPASAILELLNDPKLQAQREAEEQQMAPSMAQRGDLPKAE